MLNLVQDVRYASVDLPGQVSPNDREIVNESVTRSRSQPFQTQNLVLCFGGRDDVLRLSGKPFSIARRQNYRRPMERGSDERLSFAAVLDLPSVQLIVLR
jgi:hypothetical protein